MGSGSASGASSASAITLPQKGQTRTSSSTCLPQFKQIMDLLLSVFVYAKMVYLAVL